MSEKGHPEHIRSLPSMAPRYTVHPEHKYTTSGNLHVIIVLLDVINELEIK